MPNFREILGDVGTPTYIKPGVRKPDASGLITALGEGAIKGYEEYQGSNLEKAIQADVDAFNKQNADYATAELGMAEAAGQQKALDNLWESGKAELEGVTGLENSINNKLAKYKAAYEQGTMTSDQLSARINSTIKEAINRNPGMARELISRAKFYQETSGISSFMKAQADAEKDQREMAMDKAKKENTLMQKYGLDPSMFGGDRQQAVGTALKMQRDDAVADAALKRFQMLEKEGQLKQLVVDQAVASPQFLDIDGAVYRSVGHSTQMALEKGMFRELYPQMTEIDANLRGIEETYSKPISTLNAMLAQASAQSRPTIEGMIKKYEDMKALWKDIAMGGTNAKAAENKLKAAKATAELPYANANVQADYATKMTQMLANLQQATGKMVPGASDAQLKTIAESAYQAVTNFAMSGQNPLLATLNLDSPQGQMTAKFHFTLVDPANMPNETPDVVIGKNSRDVMLHLEEFNKIPDKTQFGKATDMYFQEIINQAKISGKPILTFMTPEAGEALGKFVTEQMRAPGYQLDYNATTNKFSLIAPDGTVNEGASKKANRMFDVLKSLHNFPTDEQMDKAGATILETLRKHDKGAKTVTPAEPTGKPTGGYNVRTVEEARQAVKEGRMSKADFKVIEKYLGTPTTKEQMPLASAEKDAMTNKELATKRAVDALLSAQERLANDIAAAVESGDMTKVEELNDQYSNMSEHIRKLQGTK